MHPSHISIVLQVSLQRLQGYAQQNQMPVLTIMLSWTGVSEQCLLCAEKRTQANTTHMVRVELVSAWWKSDFPDFVNQVGQR